MTADIKQEPRLDNMTDDSSSTCGYATPPTPMECPSCPECPRCPGCPSCPERPSCPKCPKCLWQDHGTVPWPGQVYHIVEKQSGEAITLIGDQVRMGSLVNSKVLGTRWLCVKQDGYLRFKKLETSGYLGHDGGKKIHAGTRQLNEWELWTPREHPDGGYELLSPFYAHTLLVLSLQEGGWGLVRLRYPTTLWEFKKV